MKFKSSQNIQSKNVLFIPQAYVLKYFPAPENILEICNIKAYGKEIKGTKVLPAAFAIALHVTRSKPHMVGIPTCRKTLLTPHLALVATMSMWGWGTIRVHTRFWSTVWEHQQRELSINTKGHKPPRRSSNLERNSVVSVVWSNLYRDSLAQPVNLTSRQMENILTSPYRNETMGKTLMLIISASAFS